MQCIVHGNGKDKIFWRVLDHKHWPKYRVPAGYNAVKIREGKSAFHSNSKSNIVRMVWIDPSVSISQKIVGANCVVVGPLGRSCNRDWDLHYGWLEDSLRTNYMYTFSSKLKALLKNLTRHGIPMQRNLRCKPLKNSPSNSRVMIVVKVQSRMSYILEDSYTSIHALIAIHLWEATNEQGV